MIKKISDFFKEMFHIIQKEEMSILPGNLAYSFFLSIIPILTLVVYFTSSINLSSVSVNSFFYKIFPSDVADLLSPIFRSELTFKTFIPLLISVFVVTNGCKTIINTSNTIFHCKRSTYVKRMLKSLMLAVLLIILFAFILIVPLLGRAIVGYIIKFNNIINLDSSYLNVCVFLLRWPISLAIVFLIIKIIYVIAPDDRIPFGFVNRGSLFTTIMWLIVTTIFSYYITNVADYKLVYGNLANMVILLLWFYILAYIFVIGLYLNRVKVREHIDETNSIKLNEIRNKIKKAK